MALKVKGVSESADKWSTRAQGASTEYAANAAAASDTWATNTKAAGATFQQAISSGNMRQKFERGVTKAGASKYARKIADVAADRYGPGVSAAQSDYQTGVEPYLQTLASLTLSARKPKGDPSNYRRVEEVGKALNAKRLSGLGS